MNIANIESSNGTHPTLHSFGPTDSIGVFRCVTLGRFHSVTSHDVDDGGLGIQLDWVVKLTGQVVNEDSGWAGG